MKRFEKQLRREKNRFLDNVRAVIVKDIVQHDQECLDNIAIKTVNEAVNVTSKIEPVINTIQNKIEHSKQVTNCEENNEKVNKNQLKNIKIDDHILDEQTAQSLQTSETEFHLKRVDNNIEKIFKSLPMSKETSSYGVENFAKNAMVIFNHYEIDGYKPRYGTQRDVEALQGTFSKLGFVIHVHDDLRKYDINSVLKEFSSGDFSQYGCVAVAVLTHGLEGGFLVAADRRSYHESELIEHFFTNNPTLVTKPKVFIFQACRGSSAAPGVPSRRESEPPPPPPPSATRPPHVDSDAADAPHAYYLPTQADVLLLHSTYAGSPAYRDQLEGSWFIQSLCRHVDRLAGTADLESIMTAVKKDVATNKTHRSRDQSTGRTDINTQMPVVMSTLIRQLYFKPQTNQMLI